VIGKIHHALRLLIADAFRSADRARESDVRWRERCFPDVVELSEHVRHTCSVKFVVDGSDYTLPIEDHTAQGWPVVDGHSGLGWLVNVVNEAR
jgi:hypothetical protein